MRVKVVSDGRYKVSVADAETGEVLKGVRSVTWASGPPGEIPHIVLDMLFGEVEIEAEVGKVTATTLRNDARYEFILATEAEIAARGVVDVTTTEDVANFGPVRIMAKDPNG